MENLTKMRDAIDDIDREILQLLQLRAKQSKAIQILKQTKQSTRIDKDREQQILQKLCKNNHTILSNEHITNIFTAILTACTSIPIK